MPIFCDQNSCAAVAVPRRLGAPNRAINSILWMPRVPALLRRTNLGAMMRILSCSSCPACHTTLAKFPGITGFRPQADSIWTPVTSALWFSRNRTFTRPSGLTRNVRIGEFFSCLTNKSTPLRPLKGFTTLTMNTTPAGWGSSPTSRGINPTP